MLELKQIVHCANQAPLAAHSSEAAEGEFAESEVGFDVAEDRFDADAAFAVEHGIVRLSKLVVHGFSGDRGVGDVALDMREHRFDPRH